jgi:hypothetical protein
MSIIGSELLLGSAADTGYQISRSLRFNSADSTSLSRTFSTPTSQGTYTFSFWCKRTSASGAQHIFGVDSSNCWRFNSEFLSMTVSGTQQLLTDAVFRDFSAWYHIVFTQSGTLHTIYVNNVSVASGTFTNTSINSAAVHRIGGNSAQFFNGYLADIHFIDGQALTPSSFAETNATTGQWVPKAYNGSYGNNGFQLKFADNSSNTATTLGKDTSGNGNNWTPNNLSVTAGVGNDSLVDSPTSYGGDSGAGGEVRGNYCTLNPLNRDSNANLSNGNLNLSLASAGTNYGTFATFGVRTGKWYFEASIDSFISYGITTGFVTSDWGKDYIGSGGTAYFGLDTTGGRRSSAGITASGSTVTYAAGDVVGVAFNADSGTATIYKNGASVYTFSGIPANDYFPALSSGGSSAWVNFGQRPFAYTAPSGFKALCDTNLPTPTIAKGNTVMDVTLYTGTGAARTISGLGFSPDLVWIKSRSSTYDHLMTDVVRGATKELRPNKLDLETTEVNGLTAFTSDGFSLGGNSSYNVNNGTFAGWCWDAGSSTVTNTSGTISSQVRANTSAGFSIVTYTGTGSAGATVGHGGLVGLSNGMIIIKRRSTSTNWYIGHTSLTWLNGIFFTATAAFRSAGQFNDTAPSSTVFTLGSEGDVNGSGGTFVAYCFAPVAGYSAFGSYTGTGTTDGAFVYTGFRPRWIMIKNYTASNTNNWLVLDTQRSSFNVASRALFPNLNLGEDDNAAYGTDILSNGFKIRSSNILVNGASNTYLYAAFAENPFQYARAR